MEANLPFKKISQMVSGQYLLQQQNLFATDKIAFTSYSVGANF